jgi:excisionase family DNA binding protein
MANVNFGWRTKGEETSMDDALLTVAEAAAFLRLSRAKVFQLVLRGDISSCKFGRRRLVPASAIRAYIAASMTGRDEFEVRVGRGRTP